MKLKVVLPLLTLHTIFRCLLLENIVRRKATFVVFSHLQEDGTATWMEQDVSKSSR